MRPAFSPSRTAPPGRAGFDFSQRPPDFVGGPAADGPAPHLFHQLAYRRAVCSRRPAPGLYPVSGRTAAGGVADPGLFRGPAAAVCGGLGIGIPVPGGAEHYRHRLCRGGVPVLLPQCRGTAAGLAAAVDFPHGHTGLVPGLSGRGGHQRPQFQHGPGLYATGLGLVATGTSAGAKVAAASGGAWNSAAGVFKRGDLRLPLPGGYGSAGVPGLLGVVSVAAEHGDGGSPGRFDFGRVGVGYPAVGDALSG